MKSKVLNCYNTGNIHLSNGVSDNSAGGIVGYYRSAEIKNCYNIGRISSSNTEDVLKGGIIGRAFDMANIENNYDGSGIGSIGEMDFYGLGDTTNLTESQIINYINTNTHPTVVAPVYAIDARLKGGAYVKYDTSALPDVEIPTDLTGYKQKQYACPSKYSKGWRVLLNDGDKVELISEDNVNIGLSNSSTGKTFYLNGETGCKKGIIALNNVANAYLNNTIAVGARCVGEASTVIDNSLCSFVYNQKNYSGLSTNSGHIDFQKMKYSNTSETPAKEKYWLGNPALCFELDNGKFLIGYGFGFSNGNLYVGYQALYCVYDYDKAQSVDNNAGVRPVITLRNDLEIKSGTGTSEDPYVLGVK